MPQNQETVKVPIRMKMIEPAVYKEESVKLKLGFYKFGDSDEEERGVEIMHPYLNDSFGISLEELKRWVTEIEKV